jgi:hypothetical protein
MAVYSFLDITASLVGPGLDADLGQGSAVADEGISIVMAGDKNKMTIAADGEGMHNLNADKSGTITVRLIKTSPMNSVLQTAYDAQTLSATLHGQNVFLMRNIRSGDTHAARSLAFKKKPDIKEGKEGQMLEWTFDAIKIDSILGTF